MDEILKKQDVLDAIYETMEKTDKPDVVLGLAAAMSVVKKMEGAPVGKWRIDIDKSRGIDWRRFYCPACGEWQTYGETKYCPNCGARVMSKQEREDSEQNE